MPNLQFRPFRDIRKSLWDPRLIRMTLASVIAGTSIGVVGGSFRWCLVEADQLRDRLIVWSHGFRYVGWIIPVIAVLVSVAVARLLVQKVAPEAAGSGIHRVEAIMAGEIEPDTDLVLPVKFFGGLLSLGSGMALGREGPTVQMGASIGDVVAPFLVRDPDDQKVVLAAGAGAGLAVAFNAPIGGSVFVFEELTTNFTPWLVVSTLAAATFAVATMRWMIGNQYVFFVLPGNAPGGSVDWSFLWLGGLLGIVGAGYNLISLRFLDLTEKFSRYPAVVRAAVIGAVVGFVAYFAPAFVGSGDTLTQSILVGKVPLHALGLVFILRFLLGPWCYAAETPGGMFAPLLLVGTAFGALYGGVLHHFHLSLRATQVEFAIVGMVALFAASVRAPLTGIVLATEMTGRGDLTLVMLGAALGAMVVAMLLKSPPIYESLRLRMLERERQTQKTASRLT
ncbi:MAG TPA: H(+)/Cl(-) exchange transporter ClcA [Terriglobales bacterium]